MSSIRTIPVLFSTFQDSRTNATSVTLVKSAILNLSKGMVRCCQLKPTSSMKYVAFSLRRFDNTSLTTPGYPSSMPRTDRFNLLNLERSLDGIGNENVLTGGNG